MNRFKRRATAQQVERFSYRFNSNAMYLQELKSFYLWKALRGSHDATRNDPVTGKPVGVSNDLHRALAREAHKAKYRHLAAMPQRVAPLP